MYEYCIYKHTNLLNGKIYIGMTNDVKRRWRNDGIEYKPSVGRQASFWNAIQKYGWNNFKHEVVEESLTFEEACSEERRLITQFNSRNRKIGYNIAGGGNGGKIYAEHPRGMLHKHQTEFQKSSHREWSKNHDNNPMTNGKVIWGVTNPHPKGMKGKKQTDHQKAMASKHKGYKAYNRSGVIAISPNGSRKSFPSVSACINYYHVYSIRKWLKTGEVYVFKRVNQPNKENLKRIDGYRFVYESKIEDTELN